MPEFRTYRQIVADMKSKDGELTVVKHELGVRIVKVDDGDTSKALEILVSVMGYSPASAKVVASQCKTVASEFPSLSSAKLGKAPTWTKLYSKAVESKGSGRSGGNGWSAVSAAKRIVKAHSDEEVEALIRELRKAKKARNAES